MTRTPDWGGVALTHVEPVMGTAVSIRACARTSPRTSDADGDVGAAVAASVAEAVRLLHEVHHRFTTWDADSEWMRCVDGSLDLDDAHPDVRHVAHACEALAAETDGAFSLTANPRRPPDPAAYVKGWALQRAAETILMGGADAVMVNGGGDVVVAGGDEPWRVGIQHPAEPDMVVAVVELQRGAVATSGCYERGPHLVAPSTGAPADHWASASIIGPDLGLADAYSTAAFVMGRDAPAWVATLGPGYAGYFVDTAGRVESVGFRPPANG